MPVVLYFSNFCLFFIGMILSLVVYIMLQSEDYESAANGLKYVLQLIPHFSITFGFMRFSDLVLKNNRCKIETISCPQDDICCGKSALSHPLLFTEMFKLYMVLLMNGNFNGHPILCRF